MSRKKINHHNSFSSIIIGILFIGIIFCSAFLFGRSASSRSAATLKEKNDLVIKNEVQTAVSLLESLYQQSQKGTITLDEAKTKGADMVRTMRYGENNEGYFWVDTIDGENVVLYGNKDVEGTNRWDAFVGGVYYVREIIKNGMKEGGGFTDYYFPKKNDTIPIPKRGYSILFAPFNWVVGTGYYMEDIQQ